jgi:glutamine amidotransferase-like uncharacterized protein
MKLTLFFLILFPISLCAIGTEAKIYLRYPFHGTQLPNEYQSRGGSHSLVGLYIGNGTWDTGREHLKMFLTEHKYSYRTFTAKEIMDGGLVTSGIKIILIPGGESSEYLKELGAAGAKLITEFVKTGGNYIGICAGAFYATSNREGGNVTGPYGIGLLQGVAYDGTALKKEPFIEGMMDFDFFPHFLMTGLQSRYRISMFGGPSFHYTAAETKTKNIRVVAEVQKIHEPTMITFDYEAGHVFLSGPHLEIEENRTNWGPTFADPDSEWPILVRVVDYFSGAGQTPSVR